MGGPLAGKCVDLSFDGRTLAVMEDDFSVKTYFWNVSVWNNHGSVRGGEECQSFSVGWQRWLGNNSHCQSTT